MGGGTLAAWNSDVTLLRDVWTTTNSFIDVAPGRTTTLRGQATGAGILQKNGAGTLVLAGENVNQQGQVNAGTLRVAHPAQLGDAVLNNNVLIGGGGRLQIAPGADTTEIVNTRGFQVAGVNNNVALVEIRQGLRIVQTGTGIISTMPNMRLSRRIWITSFQITWKMRASDARTATPGAPGSVTR